MGSISLVRHGQASFGKANYDQLSDIGYVQGTELGRWWSDCGVKLDRCILGGMQRHAQTATACMDAMPEALLPAQPTDTDPGFREYDHVEMLLRHEPRMQEPSFLKAMFQDSANPRQEFQALFLKAFSRWMSGQHDEEYTESWPDFRNRCIAAMERLMAQAQRSEHIAVFTSGGPISAICQHLLGLPDDRVAELNSSFANGSISRLLFQPGRVSLNTMNAFPHLERTTNKQLITYR